MSVANEINILKGNIRNAYTSIQNKGGTIPTNKNTENLSSAIDSISAGGTTTLGTKTITTNGVYNASDDNLDGYSKVTVDVSEVWQRPSDWWDTKSILKNAENIELDGVTYYPRYIMLLNNYCDTTTITIRSFAYFANSSSYPTDAKFLLKTSDGATYKSTTYSEHIKQNTHTWDKTKDKSHNNTNDYYDGTRYLLLYCNNIDTPIQYYNTSGSYNTYPSPSWLSTQVIEIIFGEGVFLEPHTTSYTSGSNTNPNLYLENFETFDTTTFDEITNNNYVLKGLYNLKHFYLPTLKRCYGSIFSNNNIPHVKKISLPNVEYAYLGFLNYVASFTEIDAPKLIGNDTSSSGISFGTSGVSSLKKINLPKLESGVSTFNISSYYSDLEYLNLASYVSPPLNFNNIQSSNLQTLIVGNGFKKTGVTLAKCFKLSKESLVDFLNKLADVTEETTTYTITLGSVNIGKLTTEELAIGTGKGWTIK